LTPNSPGIVRWIWGHFHLTALSGARQVRRDKSFFYFCGLKKNKQMEDLRLENKDFSTKPLEKATYDNCTFTGCNFTNSDLSKNKFESCVFENCDLSMADLTNSSLKEVQFKNCKLLGVNFHLCHEFLLAVSFGNCQLNLASFQGLPLSNTNFNNCNLKEVDFTETDLNKAIFESCDLSGAIFENTNLEGADFRNAFNYRIDPQVNRIRKARFSESGLAGLLGGFDIVVE